jgi:hypothetical protein
MKNKMEHRTLVVRIPLNLQDPEDIIGEIDTNAINILQLIEDRYEDVLLNVETGDRVRS